VAEIITLLARLIVGRIVGVHVIGARDSGLPSRVPPLINIISPLALLCSSTPRLRNSLAHGADRPGRSLDHLTPSEPNSPINDTVSSNRQMPSSPPALASQPSAKVQRRFTLEGTLAGRIYVT